MPVYPLKRLQKRRTAVGIPVLRGTENLDLRLPYQKSLKRLIRQKFMSMLETYLQKGLERVGTNEALWDNASKSPEQAPDIFLLCSEHRTDSPTSSQRTDFEVRNYTEWMDISVYKATMVQEGP